MIAFEISRNGKVLAVVGGKDFFGLNAVLMACGDLNCGPDEEGLVLFMKAMGVAKGSAENTTMHHAWDWSPEGTFKVGDSITIRIIETDKTSPPTSTQELKNEDEDAETPNVAR
jgi:hypothetical protein